MEDIVKEKYLTDIAYDCYNDRMAISSTTRKIHILEKNELEEWVEVASWDSQDVVLKLQWSVHEYNNLLISCGQDKQIIIWKEDKENGWNDYLNICKVGGTKSFLEIVKIGNLISAVEDGCVESVIGTIENWIDNVDDKSL